jgi:RND family efflux transporter MFP subunit
MNGITCTRGCLGRAAPLALSLALLAAGCGRQDSTPSDEGRPVKTMVVAGGGEPHVRTFPGKVEASKQVELAFQVSGRLDELRVKEGDTVAKGAVIAKLRQDDFQARLTALQGQLDQARAALRALQSGERPEQRLRLEAQVRAAEATLANARTEFNRQDRLLQTRSTSPADFERAQTALRVAQEELTAARQSLEKGTTAREEDIEAKEAAVRGLEGRVVEASIQLDDATLRAPYDGVIAKRFVEENQTIRAGEPVVKFKDMDEVIVAVDVPETVMATDIRSADIVELLAEFSGAPGRQFPVHITEVAQAADPTTQTFRVRAAMKSPSDVKLLPGMTATVTVTYRRASILGTLVPLSAVSKEAGGEQVVWVIGPDGTVTRRPVKLGTARGGQIEIVDGLHPAERIAVAGVTFLREGMKVRDLGDALGGGQP